MKPQVVLTEKRISCVLCRREFVLSPSQRFFYLQREWPEPKSCPECLKWKRIAIGKEAADEDPKE